MKLAGSTPPSRQPGAFPSNAFSFSFLFYFCFTGDAKFMVCGPVGQEKSNGQASQPWNRTLHPMAGAEDMGDHEPAVGHVLTVSICAPALTSHVGRNGLKKWGEASKLSHMPPPWTTCLCDATAPSLSGVEGFGGFTGRGLVLWPHGCIGLLFSPPENVPFFPPPSKPQLPGAGLAPPPLTRSS